MKRIILAIVLLSILICNDSFADGLVEILYVNQCKGSGNDVAVVGEISNGCPVAVKVKMRITARDKSGKVMATTVFYPASTKKINAGMTYPFDYFVCLKNGQSYDQVGKVVVSIDEVTD